MTPAFARPGHALPVSSKRFRAHAALALTAATIVALFAMSSAFLENLGYHYERPGGFPWEKFHPGTVLAVAALCARCLAADRPAARASRLVAADRPIFLYLVAVGFAALHALLVSGSPVTGLVDTFVLPALLVILLGGLDPQLQRRLGLLVCAIMALNALIGLGEYLSGWRLVPVPNADAGIPDPSAPDALDARAQAMLLDWRATALLGHPLENAVVTGSMILALAMHRSRWLGSAVRLPLLALLAVSMVAFGGRASLVLSFAGLFVSASVGAARRLAAGHRLLSPRALGTGLIALPVVASVAGVAAASGFFDRLVGRFVADAGSANARVVMWDLFDPLSLSEILLGPDPVVVTLWQHLLGIEFGIESFWVALSLAYGLVVASMLFCGLGLLGWRLIALRGRGAAGVLVFFFAVASTSTSLSSKTTGLALVVLVIVLLLEGERAANAPLSSSAADSSALRTDRYS